VEIRIAETVGMMNIAMPSIVIKMMRQKFDQQWSVRKTHASDTEQARLLSMLRSASFTLEARVEGLQLTVQNLLDMAEGHLLFFDRSIDSPLNLVINGRHKFSGQIVSTGRKRALLVDQVIEKPGHGRTSEEPKEPAVSVPALLEEGS
jgi:flagellar motor switch protein FliM